MSYSGYEEGKYMVGDDELSDDGWHLGGEKKRRLSVEQVRALEKSFELGNKLEPDRKMHLANALGLQPRQIAIWFQNRRARHKTKQLEKDYEILKKQFDVLKADNDSLHSQNKLLKNELSALRSERQRSWNHGRISGGTPALLGSSIPFSDQQNCESPPRLGSITRLDLLQAPSTVRSPVFHHGAEVGCFSGFLEGIEEHAAAAALWPWPEQSRHH